MKKRKLTTVFGATAVLLAAGVAVVGAVAFASPTPPVTTDAVAAMAEHSTEAAHAGAVEAQLMSDVSTFQTAQAGVARHDQSRTAVLATAQFAATEGPKRIRAAQEAARRAEEARRRAAEAAAAAKKRTSSSSASPSKSSGGSAPSGGGSYTGGTNSHLSRIAQCESGGNPGAVSPNGKYRGKYQFSRSTWAGVGGSGDPAAASEAEQDMRAQMLYDRSGPGQWPTCSRR